MAGRLNVQIIPTMDMEILRAQITTQILMSIHMSMDLATVIKEKKLELIQMKQIDDINQILIRNTCVQNLQLDIEPESLQYNLYLCLSDSEMNKNQICMYFYSVKQLDIKSFGGGLVQFMRMQVSACGHGHEFAKYYVEERENDAIHFYCEDIQLL